MKSSLLPILILLHTVSSFLPSTLTFHTPTLSKPDNTAVRGRDTKVYSEIMETLLLKPIKRIEGTVTLPGSKVRTLLLSGI
jgi:hypothetical protein